MSGHDARKPVHPTAIARFLDTPQPAPYIDFRLFCADVAELVDAQVSEACDGDIVEVRFLSSARYHKTKGERLRGDALNLSPFLLGSN